MDATAADLRFRAYCDPNSDPTLTDGQVAELLSLAVTTDADDIAPTEDDWVPTYSVRGVWSAIAEGWMMKAGIAAGRFSFTTDGQTFHRQQVVAHCHRMAEIYKRKLGQSVTTETAE